MAQWRFRKGSLANQSIKLECGCVYNCYDTDKTILSVCDKHRAKYNEFVANNKTLTVFDIKEV